MFVRDKRDRAITCEKLFQTKLLSRLSHKVCHLLSSPVLLRKFTIEKNTGFSICTRSDLNKNREETIKKHDLMDGSNHAKRTKKQTLRDGPCLSILYSFYFWTFYKTDKSRHIVLVPKVSVF